MTNFFFIPLNRLLFNCLVVFVLFAVTNYSFAQNKASTEQTVHRMQVLKAGMINGFVGYTSWPKSRRQQQFVIGVLGENDDFVAVLRRFFAKKPVFDDRTIVIKELSLEQVADCHLLVLLGDQNQHAKLVVEKLKGLPVLTVSDDESFTRKGGHISFFREKNKLRFEINWRAANRAKLKISSRLLKLARMRGK